MLIQDLRAAAPAEQARLLRATLNDSEGDAQGITTVLLDSIAEGFLPPPIIRTWLGVTRSPEALARAFFQSNSVFTRDIAIKHIAKMLRNDRTFESTWTALGGAHSLARQMANLSVYQHRDLCAALGSLGRAGDEHCQQLRRERITDLYDFLMSPNTNTHEERPLKAAYARLLPACTLERAEASMKELDADDNALPRRVKEKENLAKIDWDGFEQRAFERTFEADNTRIDLTKLKIFINRSQTFGIRVLEAIVNRKDIQISDGKQFMTDLALPLARRCASKHRSDPNVGGHNHVWNLINLCFERHVKLRRELEAPSRVRHYFSPRRWPSLLECAARSWSYCRGDNQSSLYLAKLIGFLSSSFFTHDKVETHLKRVAPGLRYKFLRIWLLSSVAHRIEIGEVGGRGSMSLKGLELSLDTFLLLGAVDSLALFERCFDANPDCSFLSNNVNCPSPALLEQKHEPGPGSRQDFHILRALLIKRANPMKIILPSDPSSIIETLRSTELERRKKLAREGKEPDIRAFWTLSALRLCGALKDLDLLNDTLIWARRFNRDPLTVKEIYPRLNITPFLALGIMSPDERMYASKEELKRTVMDGNRAVTNLFDTVMLIQDERSFVNKRKWDRKTLGLTARVAVIRLRRVKGLQRVLQMSDDEIFEAVLRPTLDLLVEVEATLIEYDSVDFRDKSGLISFGSDQIGYHQTPPSAVELKFWDAFATRRDELWEQKRVKKCPEVMTLPSPWPRGLPVQQLIPQEIQSNVTVPYVIKRAETIVFCDPAVALQPAPDDRDIQNAIVNFINSYAAALKLWVRAARSNEDQQTRIQKAWSFALGSLTADRMTAQEAETFWYELAFESAEDLPDVTVNFRSLRYPGLLPSFNDASAVSEWDPDPTYHQIQKSQAHRIGPLTPLDCMLQRGESYISNMGEACSRNIWLRSFWGSCWEGDVWSNIKSGCSREGSVETANPTIDALIVAAVLTVDGVLGQGSFLLKKPFPALEDPRFPAVYLDQDFLERESENTWAAIGVLKSLKLHVPPEILAQLADSLLTKLNKAAEIKRWHYSKFVAVVKLIIESDNPTLSIPLVQRFLLESHDASTYFRDIFGPKLMNSLSSGDAAEFYETLAAHIMSRLAEAQAKKEASVDESSTAEGQSAAPLVKITTAKMLAQLPRESRAIGTQRSLDTLSRLFRQSAHIDIRSAVVQSLRKAAVDEHSREFVNGFLDQWVIKLAGSLNERRPETEADWEVAEGGGPLPEVDEARPVLDLLLTDDFLNADSGFAQARDALVSSGENNTRWMKLFTKRYEPAAYGMFSIAELPPIPAWDLGLVTFLDRKVNSKALCSTKEPCIPLDVLDTMRRYVLHLMDPPHWLVSLTEHVSSSAELTSSNAGQHWLHMWGDMDDLEDPVAKYQTVGGDWACETLNQYAKLDDAKATEVCKSAVALEDFTFEMAEICINKGNAEALYTLVNKLEPRWDMTKVIVDVERGSGRVLQRVIQRVESLRTPEWQVSPQRQPHRLPDSILLRTRLLCLPESDLENLVTGNRLLISGFAEQVIDLIDRIGNDEVPYETRVEQLRARVLESCSEERLYLASLLADNDRFRFFSEPSLPELLRVRLAVILMEEVMEVEEWEGEDGIACRKMVQCWGQSACEDLREHATRMDKWSRSEFPGKQGAANNRFAQGRDDLLLSRTKGDFDAMNAQPSNVGVDSMELD